MSDLASGSAKVKAANKAPAAQIAQSIQQLSLLHVFNVKLAEELNQVSRDSIWSIFEANMRTMYTASSFGWNPPEKRAELFDPLSRFILVYSGDTLVAFVAFRFEFEEGDNVLYCYDLQISEASRRQGLGRVLIKHLAQIGKDLKLQKIMLTVLKANRAALRFYEDVGFKVDSGSPDDEDEEDYQILYKNI
ncbi:acyl-CoA N-acyltransferase [Mycena amicta]|nr:acyl-CoA N-acyltransferase [Mycena amicta]